MGIRRRSLIVTLGASAHLPPRPVRAASRVARIGWLGWSGDTVPDRSLPLASLIACLSGLSWREEEILAIEAREGECEQAAAMTAELVRAGVDEVMA